MPKHHVKITDTEARRITPPATGYALHWCPRTPGFALRVTAEGARAWVTERRVDGKTVRRTLGAMTGRGAISSEAARRLQLDISSELQQGVDRLEIKRENRKTEKTESVTFGGALRNYVKSKRRGKDGLPLKERTQADYLAMLDPSRTTKSGRPTLPGELHSIAETSLTKLDADDIRALHKSLEARGERRQTYAMQVLRAVLRHEGAVIEGNPLSPITAGRQRVALAPSRGNPSPIPPERLGAWWRSACAVKTRSADMLRFMLLTGARPGEASGLTVASVDLVGSRVTLIDTKNRSDHVILLSKQALAIIEKHTEGKKKPAFVFGIADAGKTMQAINRTAGADHASPHKLRHTFASVAEDIVSGYTLKRMLNHADAGDVTGTSYVGKSETQLRAGWQAVADFITTC